MDNEQCDSRSLNENESQTMEVVIRYNAMEASGFGSLTSCSDMNVEKMKNAVNASQKCNLNLLKTLQLQEETSLSQKNDHFSPIVINDDDNSGVLFDWETEVSQVEVKTEPNQETLANNSTDSVMSLINSSDQFRPIQPTEPVTRTRSRGSITTTNMVQPQESEGLRNIPDHPAKSHLVSEEHFKERHCSQTLKGESNQIKMTQNMDGKSLCLVTKSRSELESRSKVRKSDSKVKKLRKHAVVRIHGEKGGGGDLSDAMPQTHRRTRSVGVLCAIRSTHHRPPPARGYCGRCILRAKAAAVRSSVALQCSMDDVEGASRCEWRSGGVLFPPAAALAHTVCEGAGGGAGCGEGAGEGPSLGVRMLFPALVRCACDAGGGATVVAVRAADAERLARGDALALAKDFFRALLWEGVGGEAHAAGVVEGGALGVALLSHLAAECPRLRVETLPLARLASSTPNGVPVADANASDGKWSGDDAPATPMPPLVTSIGEYYNKVLEKLSVGGALRWSALLPLSLAAGGSSCGACGACDSGGAGDGGGGRATALDALAERSPFVRVTLPGGVLNPNQHSALASHKRTHRSKKMHARERDPLLPGVAQGEGPWLWLRPGEQLLPPAGPPHAPRRSHGHQTRPRAPSRARQDNGYGCDEEEDRDLSSGEGWLELLDRWGPRADDAAVAFAFMAPDGTDGTAAAIEAVAFAPADLPLLRDAKVLTQDPDSEAVGGEGSASGAWASAARLNHLRACGVRWARLGLRHGDLLFLPRRAALQLQVTAATLGLTWRVRPRHYCRAPWRL